MTVYGTKEDGAAWGDPDGPRFIGNELRRCHFVGLYLRFPTYYPDLPGCAADQRHIITAWGDELDEQEGEEISVNPDTITVTDSDRDGTGSPTVEYYDYLGYTDRWYFDYLPDPAQDDPYFWNIVTLAPPDEECEGTGQTAVGSYRIIQDDVIDATDLEYVAGTDVRICAYETSLSSDAWSTADVPRTVKYHNGGWEYLEVEWVFEPGNGVPPGAEVTITTEFLEPEYNGIYYDDVRFTYAGTDGSAKPAFGWAIESYGYYIAGGGGYIVGAFELYDHPDGGSEHLVGEYRLQHEYLVTAHPDCHMFRLDSREDVAEYYVGGLRFGHSATLLDTPALWDYGDWFQEDPVIEPLSPGSFIEVPLYWARGDANCDGIVNTFDIDAFVLALTNLPAWESTYTGCDWACLVDCNCDGVVNTFDIDWFVQCLTVGCAPCP